MSGVRSHASVLKLRLRITEPCKRSTAALLWRLWLLLHGWRCCGGSWAVQQQRKNSQGRDERYRRAQTSGVHDFHGGAGTRRYCMNRLRPTRLVPPTLQWPLLILSVIEKVFQAVQRLQIERRYMYSSCESSESLQDCSNLQDSNSPSHGWADLSRTKWSSRRDSVLIRLFN